MTSVGSLRGTILEDTGLGHVALAAISEALSLIMGGNAGILLRTVVVASEHPRPIQHSRLIGRQVLRSESINQVLSTKYLFHFSFPALPFGIRVVESSSGSTV